MMATEATSENIATQAILPENDPSTPETTSQDVTSSLPQPTVNGINDKDGSKDSADTADSNAVSAEPSSNGGSDTEASKAETAKTTEDDKGHARTGSMTVKKFASFKPVSVNKTFLAAKGATTAPPSKLGEKATASTIAVPTGPSTSSFVPRPRLVAKSGSGLRDSAPRTSSAANGGNSAPDASAVWNKNRPAPPPEPKRMTDEELKQQYGIHLATRLQSDDPGKQANWADIDDDDDDWAPETIEWTDGTKITLAQTDEVPPREPTPAPVQEVKAIEITKPQSPAPPVAAASPTVKPSGFGGRTGLILKGVAEKPTLVAKPPGPPTPVKSPWASLPPVDKVAPIVIEAPNQQPQQQQSRFVQRDPHGFQGMPPPPAKEIAADDFSRSSWREGQANTSRELYNSQSGRYEPVNDNRRGSRNDHSRQPAVLQRPTQQDGPAEPSAAFQTHRASGQDTGFSRRRTSSNVSGGSGNYMRRMSREHMPPHDLLNARRGSLAAVSDAPSSPRNFSPSGQFPRGPQNPNNAQLQSRSSPVVSHQSPQSHQSAHIPSATTPVENPHHAAVFEDPVEEQKKIMRQKRELAITRRQEQEAREEAAKQERIRLKLEAMGPPPEKKKDKAVAPAPSPAPATVQIQTRLPSETDSANVAESAPASDAKVNDKTNDQAVQKISSPMDGNPIPDNLTNNSLHTNGVRSGAQVSSLPSTMPHAQDSRSHPSWQNSSTWAPPPTQQAPRGSVWGPPSSDRTLGNGTFNPELSRLDMAANGSRPAPIGPPGRGNGNDSYQQGRGQYGARPSPIGPPSRNFGHANNQQPRPTIAGWSDLPDKLVKEETQFREQREAERAHNAQLQEQGLVAPIVQPEIKDTWRKVNVREDGTRSKVKELLTNTVDNTLPPWAVKEEPNHTAQPVVDDLRSDPNLVQPQFKNAWKAESEVSHPQARSRFFPQSDENTHYQRPGSPSPPPPTMEGHPAYDGGTREHPRIALPPPRPVVMLPPTYPTPAPPPRPTSFAAALSAPVHNPSQARYSRGSQDIRNEQVKDGGKSDAENLKLKINDLLRRNEFPKALTVDSSSKKALELPHSQFAATVSLPSSTSGDLGVDEGSVITKPPAEMCFEEQQMGSTPIVNIPYLVSGAAWEPLLNTRPTKLQSPVQGPLHFVVSVQPNPAFLEELELLRANRLVYILLPGQTEKKSATLSAPRGQRGNRGNVRHAQGSRGRGSRNASGNFSPATVEGGHRGVRGNRGTSGLPSTTSVEGSHRGGRANRESPGEVSTSNVEAAQGSTRGGRGHPTPTREKAASRGNRGGRGRGRGGSANNSTSNIGGGESPGSYDWSTYPAPATPAPVNV